MQEHRISIITFRILAQKTKTKQKPVHIIVQSVRSLYNPFKSQKIGKPNNI